MLLPDVVVLCSEVHCGGGCFLDERILSHETLLAVYTGSGIAYIYHLSWGNLSAQ